MKKHLLVLLSILSISFAQEVNAPSKAEIDKMVASMQEMKICIANVDVKSLENINKEALIIKDKVEAMCKKGQRDKAQETAIKYSEEMMKIPALIQMRKCTANFIPDTDPIEELKKNNVCDTGFVVKK